MSSSFRAVRPNGSRRYTVQYTTRPPASTTSNSIPDLRTAAKITGDEKNSISASFEEIYLGSRSGKQRERQRQQSTQSSSTKSSDSGNGSSRKAPSRKETARKYFSSAAWWQEEYWYALLCIVTACCLVVLLKSYDGHLVPQLGWGLQLDTAIIALVTITRVSMSAIVEAALSQGAWIWSSEAVQQRSRHEARLSDFKIFDEASRGMLGSMALLWRMKLRHLGCIGAFIIIMAYGFETFSQQMVMFEERPRRMDNSTAILAPAPPRSEV